MSPPFLSGEKLAKKLKSFEDRNIRMISEYVSDREKSTFKCLDTNCGNIWITAFNGVSRGHGCKKCFKRSRFIDSQTLESRLNELNSRDIKLLSIYKGSDHHHTFECARTGCNHVWMSKFQNVFNQGTGCAKCSGNLIDENSIKKRVEALKLRFIGVLSEYQGSTRRHDFICERLNCNCKWQATWDSVINSGNGCPRCAGKLLTNEEKSSNAYRNKIRKRISGLYKNGLLTTSVHKDDDYMAEILNYCKTEFIKLPVKPKDNQIWNLDHIIPVTKFNHTDIEQIKLCWDARNLQWLTQNENCSKSAKLMPEYFTEWHYEVLDKLGLNV